MGHRFRGCAAATGAALLLALTSAGAEAADTDAALAGEWTSDCLPIGKNGRHGYVTRITIRDDAFTATSQMYARNSCQSPTVQVSFSGTLGSMAPQEDAIAFDYVVDAITMTLHAPDVVAFYNAATDDTGCGYADWEENVARSVAGRTCGVIAFAPAAAQLFDAAWIDGDDLRFAAFPLIWTSDSAAKVPTSPLPPVYHRTGR